MINSAETPVSVFTDEGSHRLPKCFIFLITLASVSGKVSIRCGPMCKMKVNMNAWQ